MDSSSFDNSNYDYEEQQEKLAMMQTLFLPMKTWFTSLDPNYTSKFEKFPLFWRDLETWPSFRDVKKLYLAASEKLDIGEKVDIYELDKKLFQRIEPPTTVEAENGNNSTGINEGEMKENPEGEEKKKKRKNRWGTAPAATEAVEFAPINPANDFQPPGTIDPSPSNVENGEESKKPRKSRWSAAPAITAGPSTSDPSPTPSSAPSIPASPFTLTPEIMQQTLVLQMQLKQLNDKLLTVVQDAAIEELNPNRPPSPPPKYDSYGKRLNTREVRMRESLTAQRTAVIEQMMKLNPLFQPPADFIRQKPFRRLFIPYRQYPNYNFIGLIIGPRGNTQKRMERETGCKISIRGKGSVKEGSKGRSAKNNPDDDEEMHVYVQGETEESVEMAGKMIQELLTPMDDEKNEHKQKQLRELALINGTLREDEYCTICGEKGHRPFECPQRTKTFQAANVRCAICGDQSHPTRDCPKKQDGPTNEVALDNEYNSFMAELGDDGQRKADKDKDATVPVKIETEGISGGVKIEKKGRQTVIQVTNVMTGLPPISATTPTPSLSYPGMPWTGAVAATSPASVTGAPGAAVANPWGYYYPTAQYGATPSDGTTPMDPNAASNPYGYPTDYSQQQPGQQPQYDYSQYQQYYAQWYGQAGAQQLPQQYAAPPPPTPPPPPESTEDTDMG